MPATAMISLKTQQTPARPQAAPLESFATGLKWCAAHKDHLGDNRVPIGEFDLNPLTSDGLHTCCRRHSSPKRTAGRIARATEQLVRAGISPHSPIKMTQDGNDQ